MHFLKEYVNYLLDLIFLLELQFLKMAQLLNQIIKHLIKKGLLQINFFRIYQNKFIDINLCIKKKLFGFELILRDATFSEKNKSTKCFKIYN